MYGTVARFRVKPGKEAEMFELMKSDYAQQIPGSIDEWVYKMDDDPQTFYLAVLFDSRESYVKNAQSPEQDQRYRRFRALLEADPEWHDGEVVYVDSQNRDQAGKRTAA
jgi:hypothetical protein